MILYFNENGQLLESLEYGNAARVGTTHFKIFAYFEGLEAFQLATIRFRRPDLQGSEFPDLFMMPSTLQFDAAIELSDYFEDGENYSGFVFDFDEIKSNDEIVHLLDAPGLWEATITVYTDEVGTGGNVTGIITFNVEEAVSPYDDSPESLGVGVFIDNIRQLLQNISMDRFVPYTGATADVDLGQFKLLTNTLQSAENNNLNLIAGKNIIFLVPYQINGEDTLVAYKFPEPVVGEISPLDIATRQWVQLWGQEKLTYATDSDVDNLFN